jgi:catechol 2,3-dioxygenase-like lactoylglutathione lyase family enzyme
MRFVHVTLRAPGPALAALEAFYGHTLGFAATSSPDSLSLVAGETTLEFVAAQGEPFYHFALLVPGNRFDAALDWARRHATLLPHREAPDEVFDFDVWNASACYFHDPAQNIVELIAHRGIGENDADGDFQASEIVGVSELGLVGDQRAMAESLELRLALEVWDGTVDEPDDLAFVGEPARTLILAPPGRGWLPTGRAAERHEIDAVLADARDGATHLEGGRYHITGRAS